MWLGRSLVWKIITPVFFILSLLIAGVMYYLPAALKENAVSNAELKAQETVVEFKLLRDYYAKHIITEVLSETELEVGINHLQQGVIPLPATMIHDLSEIYSKRGTILKLYSPFPFPQREERQLDTFATNAWLHLKASPESSYSKVITRPDGSTFVRVAVADKLISPTCVNCHNNHPLSPKSDWTLNQIRGVLEVDTQIDDTILNGYNLGIRLSLLICVAIALVILLIFYLHNSLILSPIRKLAHMMETVTKLGGKSPLTLPPQLDLNPKSNNEIDYLYSAFIGQQKTLEAREKSILEYQEILENRVRHSTQALEERSSELNVTQTQLKAAQKEIIQGEKLTALSKMISSISHEISTPMGVATTAASYISDEAKQIKDKLSNSLIKQSEFEKYLADNQEAGELVQRNLIRAGELMHAFKQVAVDQISEQSRTIDLQHYIDEILISLKPCYKDSPITIQNEVLSGIKLHIVPGAIAQIITNLIMNSIIHGFDNGQKAGVISITCSRELGKITLCYRDNGSGIPPDILPHVFEQFYTTQKEDGGSGIGMFIIQELVTESLNGHIEITSEAGAGINVTITLPDDK